MNRREALLRAGLGALLLPQVGRLAAESPAPSGGGSPGSPERILFLVSDGMSLGVPTLAEPFSKLLGGKGTHWVAMGDRPDASRGYFDMASLNSLVTDSAAASSSWGSGIRINNGAVNQLPDGRPLTPIADVAREAGWRVGLATTTRITHATPAGFAASVPDRNMEDEIASQYLGKVDLLLGGGLDHFDPAIRKDQRDILAAYREAGYREIRDRDALARAAEGRLLGLFYRGHLPYSIDRAADAALARTVPTLAEMTSAALRVLESGGTRYLLQVEGGRVDHAAHSNDAAAILHDQLAFDEALGVALEFAREHPGTLVVATTDHGNANMGLNGMGDSYKESTACFERLRHATMSTERMRPLCAAAHGLARDAATELVGKTLAAGFGFDIAPEEAARVAGIIQKLEKPDAKTPDFDRELGMIAGKRTGIGWTGMAHTADWAPIFAVGPGSERFAGFLKNTEAFGHLVAMMGGAFRNPEAAAPEMSAPAGS